MAFRSVVLPHGNKFLQFRACDPVSKQTVLSRGGSILLACQGFTTIDLENSNDQKAVKNLK